MSTKSSLFLATWEVERILHVYQDMMDDKYYIETEDDSICMPEKYAKAFARVLQETED